jgi:hypothetical protein
MTTTTTECALVPQFVNGGWITSRPVSGEYVRRPIIGIRQGALQAAFGGFAIASFGSVEIHRLPTGVDSAEQVHPTTEIRTKVSSMCQVLGA